ncbi:hypothetical protein QNO07_13215 [Streptomyces sp. 549]|uniref:hypothetical protein n=1 Tax=Streptomyces sp. 549 TaxID=3049076 RepID=UPI0024C2FA5C|nr:hypothetical protein [Streptomyces sp. 549]MDK1474370.1 hypothetical protein [Streptomyces sp. 549]
MEIVGALIGLMFLCAVVVGVLAVVKVVRAVGRGVDRAGTEVRRGVEETALRVKSAQPGPIGQAARARLELRSSIDGTRRALTAASAHDPSLSEAMGLLDRLHDHARILDRELGSLMEQEPDRSRLAELLPDARRRVASIKESADSLRFAAQDRVRRYDAEGLDAVRSQIEIESGALRHWDDPPQTPDSAPRSEVPGDRPRPEVPGDRPQGSLPRFRKESFRPEPHTEPSRSESSRTEPSRAESSRTESVRREQPGSAAS